MMKTIKLIKTTKRLIMALTFIILCTIGIHSAKASELSFSVNTIIPDNQVDKKLSYYNLLLDPGEKQTLFVDVTNQTDRNVLVDMNITSATTNINGVIEYSPNKIKPDSSLKYNISDYTNISPKIDVPAKSTKNVKIEVNMPNEEFKGIMAGGITFKEHEENNDKKDDESKGLSIQNKYQFVVGLLMQQNVQKVEPNLKMNNVFPTQVNFRNVVNANFQNTAADYLRDMTIDANVKEKKGGESLYKITKKNMAMAPNSNFDFPMPLDGERFEPGEYVYSADVYGVKSKEGKYVFGEDETGAPEHYKYYWKFEKEFSVSGKKATDLNTKDVTVEPDRSWIYWLIAGLILLIVILILFVILHRYKVKEKGKENTDNEK